MNSIQVSLKMRVWAAVRNRPGSTVQEILAYLKSDKRTSVSSALTVLEFNEVVYSTRGLGNSDPKKYFTELEVFDPKLASHHRYRKNIMKLNLNVPSIQKIPAAAPKPAVKLAVVENGPDKIESLFDTLTMNECRALYQRLHTFFG